MKQIGEKTEARVLAELVCRDIPVSMPFGDNQRYDMIIDVNNKLYKIQIKTANYKNDYILFQTCSSSYHRNGEKHDYKGQIDYFITYCHEINQMYLVDVDEVGISAVRLRLLPARNNASSNIRLASDYEFDKVIEQLQ